MPDVTLLVRIDPLADKLALSDVAVYVIAKWGIGRVREALYIEVHVPPATVIVTLDCVVKGGIGRVDLAAA